MSDHTPDRMNISLPSDSPLDRETVDKLVEQSEFGSRSELVRAAIMGEDVPSLDPD